MGERYSIDISCPATIQYQEIRAITDKYPSCQWYASDISSANRQVISHGHIVTSSEELLKIIAEVNAHPDLWVDFATTGTGDNHYHIYVSPGTLQRWRPQFNEEYNARKAKYDGVVKKIYDLCLKGESPAT